MSEVHAFMWALAEELLDETLPNDPHFQKFCYENYKLSIDDAAQLWESQGVCP